MRLTPLLRRATATPTAGQHSLFTKHRTTRHSSTGNGNRGMDASVFKSVFQPLNARHPAASTIRDGRYLWRWDWHLRNLIYALMPPAAAYAFVLSIEWYMGDKVEAYRQMIELQTVQQGEPLEEVANQAKSLEERVVAMERYIESLEKERDEMKRQAAVKKVTRTIRQQDEVCRSAKSSEEGSTQK